MQNYRASNRVPFAGFILLVLVGVAVAIGAGLLLWAAENILNIYLIVVFPLAAAAIVGGVLGLVVRAGKVRSPLFATLIGLLAGLLMYGTYQFAGYYITFRNDMRTAFIENARRTLNDAALDREIDARLEDEVGTGGFIGFLQLVAREGFSITRSFSSSSSSSSGVDLEGTGVWVYWGIELIVIVIITAALARKPATEPFDEDDNVWYGAQELIGVTSSKARKPLIDALESGDFRGAGGMLTVEDIKYPRTELYVRRSPVVNAMPQDVFVSVNQAQRRGRTNTVKTGVITPTELDWLTGAMQGVSRPAAPPAQRSTGSAPSDRFEF